jgi:galactitol-specific phosphotransferase system IIC component
MDDPDEEVSIPVLEKRQIRRGHWAGFVVVVGLLLLITNLWIVTEHNTEITAIAKTADAIRANQKINAATQKQLTHDSAEIAQFAEALQSEVAGNHTASYAILVSICQHTPGCVVPSATTSFYAPLAAFSHSVIGSR